MNTPLAKKLQPQSLNDVLGQSHLIGPGKIIKNMVDNKKLFSMILYGDPGIGKTSIATAIVNDLGQNYRFLNATINNKKDFDIVVEEAKMHDGMILIMDEIHRLNKDKQDLLLPCVESGLITLIGMTTSNPYHSINPAIRSRCQILRLEPLSEEDIFKGLQKAIKAEDLKGIKIDEETLKYIAKIAKFDLRYAYNILEISYYCNKDHSVNIETIKDLQTNPVTVADKNGDSHFDNLSGLQKSIRGSDVHASLHYLARLINEEDLDSITRRLAVITYEDIGLANPNMGPKVASAIYLAERVGFPEATLILSNIVIELALSSKSNSAYLAIDKALTDIKEKDLGNMPYYLKSPYNDYKYPHNYKNALVKQTYLPEKIKNAKYYIPKESSRYEIALKERYEMLEKFKKE